MKPLKTVIIEYFSFYIENMVQNIELLNLIKEKNEVDVFFKTLDTEIEKILNMNNSEISEYFFKFGKLLCKYKISLNTVIDFSENLKNEIMYAIQHNQVDYSEESFNTKINLIIQNISKSYLLFTAEKIFKSFSNQEEIYSEMDFNCYKRWYIKFLSDVKTQKTLYIENYENSECYKFVNSLDFKLFTLRETLNKKTEIILLFEEIYYIAREIKFYLKNQNFKNAYFLLNNLDQTINILSNYLKNIFIRFNQSKLENFFKLFEESIIFKKNYNYFIVFSITSKNILDKSNYNHLISIFKQIKKTIKSYGLNATGIINNSHTIHYLISYNEKDEIEKIFNSIVNIIENMKQNNIQLHIPDFILRAIDTENLSGLSTDILKKLSFIMIKEEIQTPYYHFDKNEDIQLIKKAKEESKISKKILTAIKNKKIDIFFQPIIHIQNDKKYIEYSEILCRLITDKEILEAEKFIKYVIETNLTEELDIQILTLIENRTEEIAKHLKGVSLNLFNDSYINTNIINKLQKILTKFQKLNMFLIIEILEYDLFQHFKILQALKKDFPNTLKIAIDDFGSGYSSFATLIEFSKQNLLDIIKIDGSITQKIVEDELNFEILKMALFIGKKLNKKVIIEFIENKDIEEKIKTLTKNFYGQGYLYSTAVPLNKLKYVKFL